MEKSKKKHQVGEFFLAIFLLIAFVIGVLGANDLIWCGSKLNLSYPRHDLQYKFGEIPKDLPLIKVNEKNFKKINEKEGFINYQIHQSHLFGLTFYSIEFNFWIVTDDCVFLTQKDQNLPLFRIKQKEDVKIELGEKIEIKLN